MLVESLADSYGYRVLSARTFEEARAMLSGVQVDMVVAEQVASAPGGCEFLAALRTSHPDVTRVLAFSNRRSEYALRLTSGAYDHCVESPALRL